MGSREAARLDKVRVYLEYQAAALPKASGHGLLFSVDPEVELVFCRVAGSAFDSERGLIEYALALRKRYLQIGRAHV